MVFLDRRWLVWLDTGLYMFSLCDSCTPCVARQCLSLWIVVVSFCLVSNAMHACLHLYTHAFIHALHEYMHTSMQAYIHTYMQMLTIVLTFHSRYYLWVKTIDMIWWCNLFVKLIITITIRITMKEIYISNNNKLLRSISNKGNKDHDILVISNQASAWLFYLFNLGSCDSPDTIFTCYVLHIVPCFDSIYEHTDFLWLIYVLNGDDV